MKRAVSAVLLSKATKRIALVRRKNEPRKGEWSLPGGSIERDESDEDALVRELREELGIEIDRNKTCPHAVTKTRVPFGDDFYEITVLKVEIDDEPALTPQSDASDAIWISPREARAHGLAEDTVRIVSDACAAALRPR